MKPSLFYFGLRGRGEPIRLALSALDVAFDDLPVDYAAMKADLEHYPCAQCPRFKDEDVDMVQSNSIMRHIGRKHGMYGTGLAEAAQIDMILDAVESIKGKYLTLIYQDQLNEEAKAKYWDTHCAAGSTQERNGGAHLAYLAHMVGKFGKDGFAVGSKLSIADFMLFDIMDMHVRIFEDKVTSEYPDLGKHHAKVAALPRVAAYLSSDRRPQKQNGNGLG